MDFKNIKLFAFDLDGTIYQGNNLLAGAKELIKYLRDKDKQVVFHTNASGKTTKQIADKINQLGIECNEIDIFSPLRLAPDFLKKHIIDNVYVIGSGNFKNELTSNGINIIDSILANDVVVALDNEFNYNKLSIALSILMKGGRLIIANRDANYPVGNYDYLPGCGAIVSAISFASNKAGHDFCIGKPNVFMMEKISKQYNVHYKEIVVIGDSIDSDIEMARRYQSKSILISQNLTYFDGTEIVKNLQQLLMIIKNNIGD